MPTLRDRLASSLGNSYRLESELGGGGMSRVYVAEDRSLGRRVVVKALPPELSGAMSAARFSREIQVAARLQHPHIVPVLTAGAAGDVLYYTMPLIDGESLRQKLERERQQPLEEAIRIVRDVADALDYAHRHGFVHRDIKPENILLADGHALVTDFGIARAINAITNSDDDGKSLTTTGVVLGTPSYMSPEQLGGVRDVDPRSDIYSLGCVLEELLTGQRPRRDSGSAELEQLPLWVRSVLARALAVNPAERYQNVREFADALIEPSIAKRRVRLILRRPTRVIGSVAALVAVAAGAVFIVRRVDHRDPLDRNLLAIAPFEILDPQLALWREGLVDVLARSLDGAGSLRTVSPTVIVRRWTGRVDAASAAHLGRRTGARLVVFGTLLGVGRDSVRLSATLIDAATTKTLGEIELREPASRMDRLTDSLALGLLRDLGRHDAGSGLHGSLSSRPLPAVKAFLRCEQDFRRGAWQQAHEACDEAAAIDTTFAEAIRQAGRASAWYRTGSATSDADLLRAARLNHGLALRDSILIVADSLRVSIDWRDTTPGFYARMHRYFATLDSAVRRYPDDPEVQYEYGDAREHFGYFVWPLVTCAMALDAFTTAISLDSTYTPAYPHAITEAFTLGKDSLGRRLVRQYVALTAPNSQQHSGMILAGLLLDPNRRSSPELTSALDSMSIASLEEVMTALIQWRDTSDQISSVARAIISRSPRSQADTNAVFTAFAMLLTRGHLAEAQHRRSGFYYPMLDRDLTLLNIHTRDETLATRADSLLAQDPLYLDSNHFLFWATHHNAAALAEAGRRTAAAAAKLRHELQLRRALCRSVALPGYEALARNDTLTAMSEFQSVPDSLCWQWQYAAGLLTQARLLASRNKLDGADAILTAGAPTSWIFSWAYPHNVIWMLELGRVAERLHHDSTAADAYQYVLAMWSHADASLQPYVSEARRGLTHVKGGVSSTRRWPLQK